MSSATQPYDVAIVGAGPAGSASAILLARAGWRVALVDRSTFPRDKSCKSVLGPDAKRARWDKRFNLPSRNLTCFGIAGCAE